ncbi:phosphoinositide 3-kinase regulatory subunit 5-like isoform 1-T2 [Synchiropus picturatus]
MPGQTMQSSSCTEDRIQHGLERCLSNLSLQMSSDKLWNAGLSLNRWCLEELVKRDPHNFLILLHTILRKAKEVLEQCQYDLVVPLTLLFSSTLIKVPYLAPCFGVLEEAYQLFHRFLPWPDPCSSASKRLLTLIHQELRAPGISFQRLVRTEHGISSDRHASRTVTVLLLGPDEDLSPEVRSVCEQLSHSQQSKRDIIITLILHGLQAVMGSKPFLRTLHTALQRRRTKELEEIWKMVNDNLEKAAATMDFDVAREGLLESMEKIAGGLGVGRLESGPLTSSAPVKLFPLPVPKYHMCCWDKDNFDVLHDVLTRDDDLDSASECFIKVEVFNDNDNNSTGVEVVLEESELLQELQNHRISTASGSSRDSMLSNISQTSSCSAVSASSGVLSDFGEDLEEEPEVQTTERKKPKKKSKSLLGVERFLNFRTPRSPKICRRAQSMGFKEDTPKNCPRTKLQGSKSKLTSDDLSPKKHVCLRRRPILSYVEDDQVTQVRVVVFGGDREVGRLARAYSDLQRKERKHQSLTKTCRLHFYFIPTKTIESGSSGRSPAKPATEFSALSRLDNTTDIAQMLAGMDPWYERNILSLLGLSSEVLCQTPSRDSGVSESGTNVPLLADLVLYYCRLADHQVLVQLYHSELTLVGGERRSEVFVHSLELGHTAAARAIKAMGAASKRFGIDSDHTGVPLNLNVAFNKVAVSGRSQWTEMEATCTSVNLFKACRKPEQLVSRKESLWLTMTEVLKKQSHKSKKSSTEQQLFVTEVKVDKAEVEVADDGTTFAVCLDQDKKKIIQGVTRVRVSLCSKPGSGSDWKSYKPWPGQVQPLHPWYCSLLCLPITSFSASHP